jgi:hypothetical protein
MRASRFACLIVAARSGCVRAGAHRRDADPANALAVVSGIVLSGPADDPDADGGTLRVIAPWTISQEDLTALACKYVVPEDS